MEPAAATGENCGPIKISRLQQSGRFVGAVVEHHRRPDAGATVAVDGSHVGATDAVVFKPFVEWSDAPFTHLPLDQLTDRVIDHRRGDSRRQPKTASQVGCYVVLSAGDVDLQRARRTERRLPWIQPVHQRAKREQVELTGIGTDGEWRHGRLVGYGG